MLRNCFTRSVNSVVLKSFKPNHNFGIIIKRNKYVRGQLRTRFDFNFSRLERTQKYQSIGILFSRCQRSREYCSIKKFKSDFLKLISYSNTFSKIFSFAKPFNSFYLRKSKMEVNEEKKRDDDFDKSIFESDIKVLCLKVPSKSCNILYKALMKAKCVLPRNQTGLKAIISEGEDASIKLILLDKEKFMREEDIEKNMPKKTFELCRSLSQGTKLIDIHIDYSSYSFDQVIDKILPPEIERPSRYETVGHIAHFNLKDDLLKYKYMIGKVLLDKSPRLKTVVNKVGQIENKFRVFKMEVIAGEPDLKACLKEHGCTFEFDFSKVYWNSRLDSEHWRMTSLFERDDVICDMFCGVGPFAIPSAKKGCLTYANDLNPDSFQYLKINTKKNKIKRNLYNYNMDARAFYLNMRKKQKNGEILYFDHVLMNLPATAIEFLDVMKNSFDVNEFKGEEIKHKYSFQELKKKLDIVKTYDVKVKPQKKSEVGEKKFRTARKKTPFLPIIHCYCFFENEEKAEEGVKKVLGLKEFSQLYIREVRNVAPNKSMFCCSFPLPPEYCVENFSNSNEIQSSKASASNNRDTNKKSEKICNRLIKKQKK